MKLSIKFAVTGTLVALGAAILSAAGPAHSAATTGYHITNKYVLGGDAGWDYITVDPEARRVYITHYQAIEVLDIDTGKLVGRITGMKGARGIALVPSLGKGYATNGKTDSVFVVDLKTLTKVGEIPVGKKPDAIIYDAGMNRVFVNNGDGDSMSVIDPASDKVLGVIALGGGPEFLAADGKGTVWTNLFDQNAFATIDAKTMKVTKTTPIEGCKGAGGMAFDPVHRRLFTSCFNQILAVIDPDSGKVIQKLPVGEHPDANIYDKATGMIYASSGDGFITIIRQESADKYSIVEKVKTMRGAKTLGFDPKTSKFFSATVEGVPEGATSQPAPLGKVAYQHGPFVVVEVGK